MGTRVAALLTVLVATIAASVVLPPPARAATCADFPNQAAAQRAANTRDADGDGVYCESLPCPCSHAAPGSTPPPVAPQGGPALGLGRTIRLAPWRRRSGCRVRGQLPDPDCTPGTRFDRATRALICASGYAGRVRNVPDAVKHRIYAAYGMTRSFNGTDGQIDHLVSLELGGTNSMANLWPQAASRRYGAHAKDRLENALHDEVCSGVTTLRAAQRAEARDWVAAYRARFT